MTGKQKIEAALSEAGTSEIPAVICYEGICIRDHWAQITPCPWWHRQAPELDLQMRWRREAVEKIGQDWFHLPDFYTRKQREGFTIDARPEGVFTVDAHTGEKREILEPRIGGWSALGGLHSAHPSCPPETPDEIDAQRPVPSEVDPAALKESGSADLAVEMLAEFGHNQYPIDHVSSPLWGCYQLWGFEGMMTRVVTHPDLVEYAAQRLLKYSIRSVRRAAALGAAGIWIEECLTDMVSPAAFERFNVPFLIRIVDEIRASGMKSIYYFCGDPQGKWDALLAVGADALALEESKKGFVIDIEEVVRRVQGRCAVLGNLDAMDMLCNGTEAQLRAEISRQIAAGRENGSRFIMSIGSPVTPETPIDRVRLYCDLVRELGTG